MPTKHWKSPSSPRQLGFLLALMATSKNKMNVQSSVCSMQEYIHASSNCNHPCMCANADTTATYARCTDIWNGGFRGHMTHHPEDILKKKGKPLAHRTLRHHCIPHRLLSPLRGLMSNSESATGQNLRRMLPLHYASFFSVLFLLGGERALRGPLPQHIYSQAWLCSGSSVKNFGTGKRHAAGTSVLETVQSWANEHNATELFAMNAKVSNHAGGQNGHSNT